LAVAMPMPEVAPVTIASFPARQIGDAIGRRCVYARSRRRGVIDGGPGTMEGMEGMEGRRRNDGL
jgi:hypothetical protein